MRVLLDECLPRGLKAAIIGHDVSTVPEMGWAGLPDHLILEEAATRGSHDPQLAHRDPGNSSRLATAPDPPKRNRKRNDQ
jgi:hypothetical protein